MFDRAVAAVKFTIALLGFMLGIKSFKLFSWFVGELGIPRVVSAQVRVEVKSTEVTIDYDYIIILKPEIMLGRWFSYKEEIGKVHTIEKRGVDLGEIKKITQGRRKIVIMSYITADTRLSKLKREIPGVWTKMFDPIGELFSESDLLRLYRDAENYGVEPNPIP